MTKVVKKPWGEEQWIELNGSYCMKRIFLRAGFRTSLQYHERKLETNFVTDGELRLQLSHDSLPEHLVDSKLGPGDSFTVLPGCLHRVNANTDVTMIEVSTPDVDDVIRVADDFDRHDGRIASEHGEN